MNLELRTSSRQSSITVALSEVQANFKHKGELFLRYLYIGRIAEKCHIKTDLIELQIWHDHEYEMYRNEFIIGETF